MVTSASASDTAVILRNKALLILLLLLYTRGRVEVFLTRSDSGSSAVRAVAPLIEYQVTHMRHYTGRDIGLCC
jgi:hypothetical protein